MDQRHGLRDPNFGCDIQIHNGSVKANDLVMPRFLDLTASRKQTRHVAGITSASPYGISQ
jgi:hypothetical protein